MSAERLPRIKTVTADAEGLSVVWDDGRTADLDRSSFVGAPGYEALADTVLWRAGKVDEWGHHLAWPNGLEVGADRLWLESLSRWGCEDARAFLEWRVRHGLSLTRAAEALGVRPHLIASYSTAARAVPRQVMLACRGWEALLTAA